MKASGRGTARIPARLEYAVRALMALAVAEPGTVSAHTLAQRQHIPLGYLYDVLAELRRADLVYARRGAVGGYALALPPGEIRLGDVVRVLDATGAPNGSPLPQYADGDELSARLGRIWLAAEQATRRVFDEVTLADLMVPAS
jgi:Rrf2 family protein